MKKIKQLFHCSLVAFFFLLFLGSSNGFGFPKGLAVNMSNIQDLFVITRPITTEKVILFAQGGPTPRVLLEDGEELAKNIDPSVGLVTVHQVQTLQPDFFRNNEISFKEAKIIAQKTVDILHQVIQYFKSQNKKIYLIGLSWGGFVGTEYIGKYGTSSLEKALLGASRINLQEEFWKAFSEGKSVMFKDQGKTIDASLAGPNNAVDRNMGRLGAGLGNIRFTDRLKSRDLSKVVFIHGISDNNIGAMDSSEIAFLKSKKAKIVSTFGMHQQTYQRAFTEAAELLGLPPALQADSDGFINRKDFNLFYTIYGKEGPLIVLLSGGPGSEVDYMLPLARFLRTQSRVVALEQRGTGRSALKNMSSETLNLEAYVEDIEALRKALKEDSIIVLGNSWGMMLGLAYASTYPKNTKAVVTVGSGFTQPKYAHEMTTIIFGRLSEADKKSIEELNKKGDDFEATKIMLKGYFYDLTKLPEFVASIPKLQAVNMQLHKAFVSLENIDIASMMPKITAPTLLIQGEYDIVPKKMIEEAHALIKNSRLELVPKVGHTPWFEAPDLTFTLVGTFLEGLKSE